MRFLAVLAIACAAVAAHGEPRGETSSHPWVGLLAEVEFAPGSARGSGASSPQLGRAAAWALEHHGGLLVLDGHADRRGPAANDIRLSLRRAAYVRDRLLELGVDPDRIVIAAFGSEPRRHARVAVWATRASCAEAIAARARMAAP